MFIKRVLMTEADSSPGNGAVVASVTDASTQPAAQSPAAPAAPAVDTDAIAAKVRDSLFAELRRSGAFGKQAKSAEAPASSPAAPPSSQPDPLKLRSLDRALSKLGLAQRLSDSQYQRAEKAFAAEDPGDAEVWARDYFDGFGAAQPSTPTTAQPAPSPARPMNDRPVSDRGSPPPSQVPLAERQLSDMSESDRAALIKEKGLSWFRTKLASELKGRPIVLRR